MKKSGKCVYYSISEEGRNHIINIIDALTKINGYSEEGESKMTKEQVLEEFDKG